MYFSIAIELGWGQRKQEHEPRTITAWSWKRLSEQVKNRDGSVCQHCGAYAPGGGADHVTPLSRGGSDALDNLVWACTECNSSKGDKTPEEWDAPDNPRSVKTIRVEIMPVDDDEVPQRCFENYRAKNVRRFAAAALHGQLTHNAPHRLSRRRFTMMRDEALNRGLLAWIHPDSHNQGVEVTQVGKQVFEQIATELNDGQASLL